MADSSLAPIAIFCYRRARHLQETLQSLSACPEFASSPVYVFADGAKGERDRADVADVRQLLASWARPGLTVVAAEANQGLARSVIAGVTRLCSEYGRVIVIEDDLLLHPATLTWMNKGLDALADDARVYQVSAHQFAAEGFENRRTGSYQRFVVSWGWATWQRAWAHFDPLATGWEAVRSDPGLRRAFNCNDSFPLAEMLEDQMTGRSDSWAIRWSWSVFRRQGLTLMPPATLVRNVGFDDRATHSTLGALKRFMPRPPENPWRGDDAPDLPPRVALVPADVAVFERGLRRTNLMRNRRIKAALAHLPIVGQRFR
ncbi:glycosyltransferase [Zavarzinia sp. CC-PAN008]|uniref:glycosyltransferase n=1 Tax=Zavarzinia sp. CC-PAN008 TaxID=3243332 RepID=UPI003F74541A